MKAGRHEFGRLYRARAPATAATLLCIMWIIGCGGGGGDEESRRGETPGASPQHFEPTTATASARPIVLETKPPAPRPSGPLPEDASCVTAECHANLASAPQIHSPVAQGACDSCHEPDIGGHRYPLKRAGTDSCTFCHSVTGTASHQHAALDQGCNACHEPHTSQTKFLLKADSVEHLCLSCHDMPLKRFAHGPVAQGQCTLCHQPHEATNAMLLRGGEGAEHCFTCHGDLRDALASSAFVHEPAAKDCGQCHSPHTTDHPHLLSDAVDQTCLKCHESVRSELASATVAHAAMSEGERCINCHAAHRADDKHLMRDRMDNTCLSCHDKPVRGADGHEIASMQPVLTRSAFLHGAIRAGDCSACHDTHGAQHHSLLSAAFPESSYADFKVEKYDLCFESCHSPQLVLHERTTALTNFRDGDVNLHYLHVHRDEKGRSCRTCHEMHGSNLPNHMAAEVPFERSGWAMPIEFEKKPDGGSCAPGCHAPRTYARGPADPTTAPAATAPTERDVP